MVPHIFYHIFTPMITHMFTHIFTHMFTDMFPNMFTSLVQFPFFSREKAGNPWFGKRPNYFQFFLVKASLRLLVSQKGLSKGSEILHGVLTHKKIIRCGNKIERKLFNKISLPLDTKHFCWCQWGAEWRVQRAHTWERGPTSAPAEICISIRHFKAALTTNFCITNFLMFHFDIFANSSND
jgi:hypothetical protein